MNSPLSFFGKCFTVLVGGALSWATVTVPEFESTVAKFVPGIESMVITGEVEAETSVAFDEPIERFLDTKTPQAAPIQNEPRERLVSSAQPQPSTSLIAPAPSAATATKQMVSTSTDRIDEISYQLRQMGASYLLLEKLQQSDRVQYRVRCDLANETKSAVKCCFEVTREDALSAMEEVLHAAKLNLGHRVEGQSVASSM